MFGLSDEDMARLRVAEARKNGLHEQYLQRNLGRVYRKRMGTQTLLVVIFLTILLAITLGFL